MSSLAVNDAPRDFFARSKVKDWSSSLFRFDDHASPLFALRFSPPSSSSAAADEFFTGSFLFDAANSTNLRPDKEDGSSDVGEQERRRWEALFLLVFPVLTAFGNVLVCASVCTERCLQTVTNYFIVSLAVADLMVAVLVMPLAVYVEVNNSAWNLSDALCDTWIAFDVMSCTASILNLTAISVDRFTAVTSPLNYAKHKRSKRVYLMMAVPWTISFAISSPIALGLNYTDRRAATPSVCTFYNSDFLIYSSMTSFYIPCVVMVLLYWRIYLAIRGRTRQALNTGRRVGNSRVLDGTNFHNTAAEEAEEEEDGGQEGKEGGVEEDDDDEEDGEAEEPGRKDALEAIVDAAVPGCFDEAPNEPRFGDDDDENEEHYSDQVFSSVIANAFFVDDDCVGTEEASENPDRVPSGDGRHQSDCSESSLCDDLSSLAVNGSFSAHARAETVETFSSLETTEDYERKFAPRGDYCAACTAGSVNGPAIPSINIQLANTVSNNIDATRSCIVKNPHNLSTAAPWVPITRTRRANSWRLGSAKSKPQGSSRPGGRRRMNFRDLSGSDCPPAANAAGLGTTLLGAAESNSLIMVESKRESSFVQFSAKYVFGDRGLEIAETALSAKRKRVAKREKKATKTLAIVLGVFLICWMPFFTVNIVNAVCLRYDLFARRQFCDIDPWLFSFLVWLGYINSFLNPVIYTIFNAEFRRAFRKILRKVIV